MPQPQLFHDPTAREPEKPGRTPPRQGHLATPAPIGSGPDNETCKTCSHCALIQYHDKDYRKCDLMKKYWTHGGGTDIRLKWAACKEWRPHDARVLALGSYAVECIGDHGWFREPLLIIADYYDSTGQDMGWLRCAAANFPSMPQKPGGGQ